MKSMVRIGAWWIGVAVLAGLGQAAWGAPVFFPESVNIPAGNQVYLQVTNLNISTNFSPSEISITAANPDEAAVSPNVITQTLTWTYTTSGGYFQVYNADVGFFAAGRRPNNGVAINARVRRTLANNPTVIVTEDVTCIATVTPTVVSFAAMPRLSLQQVYPATLIWTNNSFASLLMTIVCSNLSVARLGTDPSGGPFADTIQVEIPPYESEATFYITAAGVGTAGIYAIAGPYITGLSVVVSTNLALEDPDADGVPTPVEYQDKTHPLHPMSSTNYAERSLDFSRMAPLYPSGITIPQASFDFRTNGWAVECWVYPKGDGNGTILSMGSFIDTNIWVGLENYRPKATIWTIPTGKITVGGVGQNGSIQQLPTNEWSHIACVWSPDRNSFEMFVNGVLLIAWETMATPYVRAHWAYMGQGFSEGAIDEVRIWSYDRSWSDIAYWHKRIYPAPVAYVATPFYGQPLQLYYRFDDATTQLVDYAYLNDANYFLQTSVDLTTNSPAVSALGSDDQDGDFLPEWWVGLHNLDQYPTLNGGPTNVFIAWINDIGYWRVYYYRSIMAYTSVGITNNYWLDTTDNMYYRPKTGMGWDGRYSGFLKYVYLTQVPNEGILKLYTPGMLAVKAYVNGTLVTPEGAEGDIYQTLDVTDNLKLGRNAIYVFCESVISYYLDIERTQHKPNPQKYDVVWEGAQGKFDAELLADGAPLIRRGDHSRADPRAVWFCQIWSTYVGQSQPLPDAKERAIFNQDYGLPFDADTDDFNAYYEYFSGTNPQDDDSDNNGVPDGYEDFDGDGLVNRDEQTKGTQPLLPDTDDDSVQDGLDSLGNSTPASALSSTNSLAMVFGGNAEDYVEFPIQSRFALENWTVEAWVFREAAEADGGVIVQRKVSTNAINYEIGLGNGSTLTAATNVPYVRFMSVAGSNVVVTSGEALGVGWTHVAASYEYERRLLKLFVNGALTNTASLVLQSPALFAGGPVQQRIGPGLLGMVDEVRIWNVARTDEEIKETYQETVPVTTPNLAGYYRFDDNTSYATSSVPITGTSQNNRSQHFHGLPQQPWRWGQVQDCVVNYITDWWNKWDYAATLHGNSQFSTNGAGALQNPPSLQITLLPPDVVKAGARWTISGDGSWNWYQSGYVLSSGLSSGQYDVVFSQIPGWTTPSNLMISLQNNQIYSTNIAYLRNGNLRIQLLPQDAVTAGAKWRAPALGSTNWLDTNTTITNITPGLYYIEFLALPGWQSPGATNVVVPSGQTISYNGVYTRISQPVTAIRVDITPPGAVAAGAQWKVLGNNVTSDWQVTGGMYPVSPGLYVVSFRDVFGWVKPPSALVIVSESVTTSYAGEYYPSDLDTDGDGLFDYDELNVYFTDRLNQDTDDDGVDDKAEMTRDLTSPVHPMSSTNFHERSLDMGRVPAAGMPVPSANRYYVGSAGWTVETWIRPGADGNGLIFGLTNATDGQEFMVMLENYRPKAQILSASNVMVTVGGVGQFGSIQQLPRDEWSHVACVWAPERDSFELYLNGLLLIAQQTLANPNFKSGRAVVAQGFADGYLDEFRTWPYARSADEVSYWFNRLFPAPSSYVQTPLYGTVNTYFRFDDAGKSLVDFAYLPELVTGFAGTNYFVRFTNDITVIDPAFSPLGVDDQDGDGLPEWWAGLHNLDQYPSIDYGPIPLFAMIYDCDHPTPEAGGPVWTNDFDKDNSMIARVDFAKTFRAYSSIGATNALGGGRYWVDEVDNMVYEPRDVSLGYDGRYVTFMKYVYLAQVPRAGTLKLFTPGMKSTIAFVNGVRVTPTDQEDGTYQTLEVANQLKVGRNMIYVYCVSGYDKYHDYSRLTSANSGDDCTFEGVYGKFDASFSCDGQTMIVRGDHTRNDPRAVWFCQTWSTAIQGQNPKPPFADSASRAAPGNADYGLPLNTDTDTLNANYEFSVGSNPHDDDSDNNGIPDGHEDYDGDGLVNIDEQSLGADALLPDTDDDGQMDGIDAMGNNSPANALSSTSSLSMVFGGAASDYLEFAKQKRFAVPNWTVESWVRRDPLDVDGGIIIQRWVATNMCSFELGLGDGTVATAPVNVPYVKYSGVNGSNVICSGSAALGTNWTHVAGVYEYSRRLLSLYINGGKTSTAAQALSSPAIYAGGPVIQRIGRGLRGNLDELRIWSAARTDTEIKKYFDLTVPTSSENLAGYYRFDDNTSYKTNPLTGTSRNNLSARGLPVNPWRWGQVQDCVAAYNTDWGERWVHAASMLGNVRFSANGDAALDNPPSLQVLIYPTEAVNAGARWYLLTESGNLYPSGYILTSGLTTGLYTLAFSPVGGWRTPDNIQVFLRNNTLTITNVTYTQNASLRVSISGPAEARWRVYGSTVYSNWLASGSTLTNLQPTTYPVEFLPVAGWSTPATTNLLVASGELNSYTFTYLQVSTGLRVYINPSAAVTAGARWRIIGGSWMDSGMFLGVEAGTYTVEFTDGLNGWYTPDDVVAVVSNGYTSEKSGYYYQIQILGGLGTDPGLFNQPRGLAYDATDSVLYVADYGNNRIQRYYPLLNTWSVLGTNGTTAGRFRQPMGVWLDSARNIYVADSANNRVQKLDILSSVWTVWGGTSPGTGAGQFNVPVNGAADSSAIYVADIGNNRIQKYYGSTWSTFITDGFAENQVRLPQSIVFANSYCYVADFASTLGGPRIRKFTTGGAFTKTIGSTNSYQGTLTKVGAMCLSLSNNLAVADRDSNRILAFSLGAETWNVQPLLSGLVDRPEGIAWNGGNRLYIADTYHNRIIVLTLAGEPEPPAPTTGPVIPALLLLLSP